ncbi:MAG: hypothetical protein ACRBN8_23555 [Nannocystales bacterium]
MADAPLHVTAKAGAQTSESQIEPETGRVQRLRTSTTEAEIIINPNASALAASTAQSLQSMKSALLDWTACSTRIIRI